jgi:uncharacterized phiE125 gp8 family phage protein
MAVRWESKRPGEVRDYRHDWSPFLDGDTIATSDVTVTPATVTLDSDTNDDTSVTVWLSDGESGDLATITNTIVTAGGRTETEIFTLYIRASEEPVSLATAKAHLRVTDESEDAIICAYLRAAREWVENYTRHIIVQRPITQTYAAFGDYLEINYRPFVSVDTIAYDSADDDQVAFTDFEYASGQFPIKVYPTGSWPSLRTNGYITVTFTAGYSEGAIPDALIHAILVILAGMFANRGGPGDDAERTAKSLLHYYRKPVVA